MNNPATNVTIDTLKQVLNRDTRVFFAYLYGSYLAEGEEYRDIDIAVYAADGIDRNCLATDLKILFHKDTGLSPDLFDVRIINDLVENGDLFALIYLHRVLENNELLVDKNPDVRTDFLLKYSMKYRECEGIIGELIA